MPAFTRGAILSPLWFLRWRTKTKRKSVEELGWDWRRRDTDGVRSIQCREDVREPRRENMIVQQERGQVPPNTRE
jgi:hypothetical protein